MRAGWRPFAAFLVAAALPLLVLQRPDRPPLPRLRHDRHPGLDAVRAGRRLRRLQRRQARAGGAQDCARRARSARATRTRPTGTSGARRRRSGCSTPRPSRSSEVAPTNQVLESFSRAMIRHHPLDFVGATLSRLPALLHTRRHPVQRRGQRDLAAAIAGRRGDEPGHAAPRPARAAPAVQRARRLRARLPQRHPRAAAGAGAAGARGAAGGLPTRAGAARDLPAGRQRADDPARHRRDRRLRAALPAAGGAAAGDRRLARRAPS